MKPEKRELLTKALVKRHLKRLSSYDDFTEEVTAWLTEGRVGYNDMSDDELLEAAEDQGWAELGLFEEDFRPSKTEQGVENLNWTLLRQQKARLLHLSNALEFDDCVALRGIVHLIDAIQDNAVADGLALERVVFPEEVL